MENKMASDDSLSHRTNVLIIGAGIAGIAAGEYMTRKGFTDFKILEASDRVGGRIWTIEFDDAGHKAEMGANWIHGIERNPIFQIADENGLLQLRYKDKGLRHRNVFVTEDGEEVSSKLVKDVDFMYGLLIQQCEEFFQMGMPTPEENDSVGAYLEREISEKLDPYSEEDRRMRELVFNQHLRQECCISGCDTLSDVSLSEFGGYEELPGIHYTIPPGFQSVLNILKSKIPEENILLNSPVRCVHWDMPNSEVCVECESGEKFYANYVIVTVSLGVLKAACERMFDPQLPDGKIAAIDRMGFGIVDKVMLYFGEPIVDSDVFRIELLWDDEQYGDKSEAPNLRSSWFRKIYSFEVLHENLLIGWVCGKEALYMESLSEEEIGEDCVNILRKFLKKPDISAPKKVIRTCWGNDPNTRGSYCYIRVGATVADVETLMEPVYRKASDKPCILFAGEGTHPSFYSTTHGALLTGYREAKRILELTECTQL
ncbi:hypothetical protein CHS0354_015292 [Potamilus streckersoni]|uniref:Amine oxidase domain-containing protein n=1 Tax=Potamilus streckersoni TaxID=2493646 RepID=A0AAE0VN29_9BIVA|nr:hypothetical protein CHS0354_015292 [Potamilus streckersoni]